jgi:hypothetical protein
MAAKFFTGLPLDGPDPECVRGFGEQALAEVNGPTPKPSLDHSHKHPLRSRLSPAERTGSARTPVPITLGVRPLNGTISAPPVRGCDENPLTGFSPTAP